MTQPTPPSDRERSREAEVIAAVAALLAVNQAAESLSPRVARLALPLGLSTASITRAVTLAMSRPIPSIPKSTGESAAVTRDAELTYRAAYIVASARRFHEANRVGGTTEARQAELESNYYRRHLLAAAKRATAAKRVDSAAKRHGDRLGWYAKNDIRTTAECRWAHGRNFQVSERPPFGYPGTVHVNCRCVAGRPHNTSKTVYDRRRAAA